MTRGNLASNGSSTQRAKPHRSLYQSAALAVQHDVQTSSVQDAGPHNAQKSMENGRRATSLKCVTSVWPTMVADTACCITLEFSAAPAAVQRQRARPPAPQDAQDQDSESTVVLVGRGTPPLTADGRIIVHDSWICILLPCSKQRATNAHPVPIRDVRPTTPGPPNTLKVRATQTTEVEVRPSL